MNGLFAPWRARIGQWRAQPWVLVLFSVLIGALTAASVALPRALAAADEARFAAVVTGDHAAAAELSFGVKYIGDASEIGPQLDAALADARAEARDPFRQAIDEAAWIAQLEPLAVEGLELPDGAAGLSLVIGGASRIPATGTIDGELPGAWDGTGPMPIGLDTEVARRLGLSVGDEFDTASARLRVSGVFDIDPDAAGADHRATLTRVSSERLVNGATVLTAGAWAAPDAFATLAPTLLGTQVTGWLAIDPGRVSAADRDELAAAIRASASAGAYLTDGQSLQVSSRLPTLLARSAGAEATAHALVWLLSSGWIAALLAAIVMTAVSAARGRERARALLSARGATQGRMLRDGAADLVLIALPGAAAGAALAVVLVPVGSALAAVTIVAVVVGAAAILGAIVVVPRFPVLRPVALAAGALLVAVGLAAVLTLRARGYAEDAEIDAFVASAPATAAAAAAVVLAAVLPPLLAVTGRMLGRGRHTRAWLGARWGARRGAGFAPMLAVLLAMSSLTTALFIGQAVDEGLDAGARAQVGGDLRVSPGEDAVTPPVEQIAALDGVAAAASVDALVPATVTDGGRVRAVAVYVADTAALHAVREDLPVLAPGEALAAPGLADALGTTGDARGVEIDGARAVDVRAGSATLPVADERWLLLDAAALTGEVDSLSPRFTLVRASDPAVAEEAIRARYGADVSLATVSAARTARDADSTVGVVRAVLGVGAALPAVLAVAAVIAAVLGSAREREDAWAVARLAGARLRGRSILALWQVGPVVLLASAAGVVLGALLTAVIRGATDLAAATGGLPAPSAPPILVWAVVPVMAAVLLVAALLTAVATPPRRLALLVRNGAS
jgi:putative ABC transport system permease protein